MGLFQQKPEEQQNEWAGLPSEPLNADETGTLDAPVDPLTLGLGNPVTSIVIPVAPPAPDAAGTETAEPAEGAGAEPSESEEAR